MRQRGRRDASRGAVGFGVVVRVAVLVVVVVAAAASCRPRPAPSAGVSDCAFAARPAVAAATGTVPESPSTAPGWPPAEVFGNAAWSLVFHDEFDDRAFTDSAWSSGMRNGAQTLEGNGELQRYSPANSVLTSDRDRGTTISVLEQRVRPETVTGKFYTVRTLARLYPPARCPELYDLARMAPTDPTRVPYRFTSGMLNSAKSFGFRYGYVEARVKLSRGFALWPALWLRNWDAWSHEIDVFEGFDRDARLTRTTYWWGAGSHWGTNNDGGDIGTTVAGGCRGATPLPALTSDPSRCSLASAVDLSAGYHTFGLQWTESGYRLYIDGVRRWESAPGAAVDSSYNHLILNLALGNNSHEFDWTDEPMRPLDVDVLASSAFPKPTIEWDYVRVWQPTAELAVCTTGTC